MVNLTPHEIKIVGEDGEVKAIIPPSGRVARVKTEQTEVGKIKVYTCQQCGFTTTMPVMKGQNSLFCPNCDTDYMVEYNIPVVKTVFGDVEGLPLACENCKSYHICVDGYGNLPFTKDFTCQQPSIIYIVSSLVAQAAKDRNDVIAPDTSPAGVVRDEQGRIIGVKRFQRW